MGALMAAGFYRFIKWSHYEEANPNREETDHPNGDQPQPAQHSSV
jgi:aquaporin related protein